MPVSNLPQCGREDQVHMPGQGGVDAARRFHDAGSSATVLDFLSAMHRVADVNYSYAWWDAFPMLTWVGGSLLLIGGIRPTLINLLAFGTLTRPPEARALSLWGVGATRAAPPRPVQIQVESMDELDEELEAALHGPAEAAEEAPQTPAPRPLTTAPLDSIAPLAPGDSKEFGADPEDFYPTERHVHRD